MHDIEPTFRPFTREENEKIENRIFEKKLLRKKRDEQKRRNVKKFGDGARAKKHYLHDSDDDDDSEAIATPNKRLEQGNDLPRRYGEFPLQFANTPICDIDPYYADKRTFIVVSKSKAIFRFSATPALFVLTPFHPIRRIAIRVLTHPIFNFFIITTILVNCYVMMQPDTEYTASTEILFTAIYTYESATKLLARGFLLDKFTYLRDAWNWLDFAVIGMSYVTIAVNLGSFSSLRTFRVFRALKSVAVVPGLKTIVGAIIYSVKNLKNVTILTIFGLSLFALLGLQLYMGVLTQICIADLPDWFISANNGTIDDKYASWYSNSSNFFISEVTGSYIMCGNSTGAGKCPEGTICLAGFGPNPNYGYTTFDNFALAYLCAFRLMTQDYWENLYQITLRTAGAWNILFFILNIFMGSFYLINLILAIVAMSYDELQRLAEEEAERELEELEAIKAAEIAVYKEAESALEDLTNNIRTPHVSPPSLPRSAKLGIDNPNFRRDDEENEVSPFQRSTTSTAKSAFVPDSNGKIHSANNSNHYDLLILKDVVNEVSLDHQLAREKELKEKEEADEDDDDDDACDKLRKRAFKIIKELGKIFCIWDCCQIWIRMSECFSYIVFDPFVDLFITICIAINVATMTLDHYNIKYDYNGGMSEEMTSFLIYVNYFFTIIFALESFMKIMAMSPRYFFADGRNCFDFLIVVLSLVELLAEDVNGLSMLRSFRLLRVFKLAKSWKSLNDILTIMANTIGALSNLTFVLCIIIFIFAVMGMQLFGRAYVEKACEKFDCVIPRWNFTDFLHSIMIVFRVLCGEWIESMWACMHVAGPTCVPYFLATVLVANLVILNLFLALLLSSFSDMGGGDNGDDGEMDKTAIAINRFKRLFSFMKLKWKEFRNKKKKKNDISTVKMTESNGNGTLTHKTNGFIATGTPTPNGGGSYLPINQSADYYCAEDKDHDEIYYDPLETIEVENCCPASCYKFIPIGDPESPFWIAWSQQRLMAMKLIENDYFEAVVLGLILLSSFVMTLEDIWFETRPALIDCLYYLDRILTVVFFLETSLKLFAMGPVMYFGNAWCWLDFIIVSVSIINFLASLLGAVNIPIFKTMRTLRALRPLRAMAKMEGMKVVVNALVGALPSIFNVLVVCIIFWLIFAIIGVNIFMGTFYKCVDKTTGERFSHEIVPNKTVCLNQTNSEWKNSKVTFDNTIIAYLALLQVATWKGWITIMDDAIDSVKINSQPHREANKYMYLYFVAFIICGSFFTLNLLVGVIIDKFNEQKNKGGSSLDAFMTEDQKKYIAAMKKASKKKPLKALPRPYWKPQAIVFGIVTNKKFDMIIMGFIGLNMLTMMMDHYQQSEAWTFVLDNLNVFFIVIFTLEMLLKVFALRQFYFLEPWNLFDFFIVLLSLGGLFLSDIIEKYFISPTLLRVVRVVKVGRVLRLIKGARGIRTLLFSLVMALPALGNICLLLFLIMFIFAVFGMSMFKHVKIIPGFDDVHNFQTFGKTITLLFQICTSAGWAETFEAISNTGDGCTPQNELTGSPGDCGSYMAATIFIILYLVLSFLIIVNMYIAVILENYSQASEDVQEGITEEDYDLFYEIWQEFDPNGTQYMSFDHLCEFLDVLEPPLQISRPNKFKIINMDIPIVRYTSPDGSIVKENMVFCSDILDAVTQDFFARKGNGRDDSPHVEEVKVTAFGDRPGYERTSSSWTKQRENYCASLMKRAWKMHRQ